MATTTFLFVDQVGSTEQLTRLGDASAQHVRRALFDLLRQSTAVHGGREVDFTGDGLFCSFEGATDAVDAAVEMQQGVTTVGRRHPDAGSLAIRIGLHTGEPLASEGGGHFGSAVVVASRLCSQAGTGQILVSALVRALVEPRGRHAFRPVGSLTLKGIPAPVDAYEVEWTADDRHAYLPPPLAAARTGPFVGRRREVEAVLAAWRRIAEGGRRLVLISGDPGMGSTRLAAECAERLRAAGASVWAGVAQGTDERLAAWAEAVEGWASTVSRAELRQAVGDSAQDLVRLLPALSGLLPRMPSVAPVDAQAATYLIADAVDAVAERWSAVEPLVLVLDRLHQADTASLTVLRRLLHSRRGGRVMVIGCYEPSSVGVSRVLAALEDVGDVVDLRLSGLEEHDVRTLVGAITGEPVTDQAVRAVLAESEGNPYFVLQMARSMHQEGITRRVEGAVGRAVELRSDLRLQREEIALGLRQLDELREDIAGAPAARIDPDGTPPAPGVCPYRGLLAFTAEDADTFFGRDALIAEMVAGLSVTRWLAVVGPSGSGKSSAVRAGLHPALARGALPGSTGWVLVDVRPGAHPLDALGEALARPAATDAAQLARELSSADLGDVCRRIFGSRRLVVHVDQFEELWTAAPPDVRIRTLDLLVGAATAADEAVSVVVTMRADYYGRTAEHPGLAALMADSQVLVPPMTPAELRAAVELPARHAGLVLEPGLAQAVVDDVADEPGTLPLLSTAMQETWERRRGRSLTLTAYAETGGARRAIAHLADATLDSLDPRQQEIARRLLLRLAAPSRDGGDVARPAPISELVVDGDTQVVLDRLADRRLVTVGAMTVQVAHEALLREWPRLREWLDADRDGRWLQQQIATAADEWEAAGRDDDMLLRGARLAAADEWRREREGDLSAREREFLDASVGLRERELQRARRTTRHFQILAVVLVVLVVGAGVATYLAVDSSRTAQDRANQAIARDLVNQTGTLARTRPDTALLLAVEAYRRNPSRETQGGLLTGLSATRYVTGFHHELPSDIVRSAVTSDGSSLCVLTLSGDLLVFDTTDWSAEPVRLVDGIADPFALDVSPDGRTLLFAGSAGVQIVDRSGGAPRSLSVAGVDTVAAQFSADGRFVVSTEGDSVVLRDSRSGAEEYRFDASTETIAAVRPGRDELVVASDFGRVLGRTRLDGAPLQKGVALPAGVRSLSFTADGEEIFVGVDGGIHLLDADTLRDRVAPLDLGASSSAAFTDSLALSPAGREVMVGYSDGAIGIVDVEPDAGLYEALRIPALPGGMASPEWLGADRFLTFGVPAAEFDLRAVSQLLRPLGEGISLLNLQGVTVSSDRSQVFYVADGRLRQISASGSPGTLDMALPIDPVGPAKLAVSSDATWLAVAATGPPEDQPAASATDPPAGRLLLVPLTSDGDLVVRDVDGFTPFVQPAFAPDGRTLAFASGEQEISQLALPTASPRGGPMSVPGSPVALRYSTDGGALHVGDRDGRFWRLDTVSGRTGEAGSVSPNGSLVTSMAFSPSTDRVAMSTTERRIVIADPVRASAEGAPLQSGNSDLGVPGFSEDGSWLAAADDDGALHLWDLDGRREVGSPLRMGTFAVDAPVFVDGDRRLVVGTSEGLMSWDLDPTTWRRVACELAGRDLTREEWGTYLPGEPYRTTCSTG